LIDFYSIYFVYLPVDRFDMLIDIGEKFPAFWAGLPFGFPNLVKHEKGTYNWVGADPQNVHTGSGIYICNHNIPTTIHQYCTLSIIKVGICSTGFVYLDVLLRLQLGFRFAAQYETVVGFGDSDNERLWRIRT
jgi:hypothetical protein